jgi:hypothetical protein
MKRVVLLATLAVALVAVPAQAKTVWLCNATRAHDLCKPDLTTTLLSNGGQPIGVRRVHAKRTRFDCFYIYPTVSDDKTPNSDLSVDPEERSIALYQVARYSQYCRVFAPMYRQITLTQLLKGTNTITPAMSVTAYKSALAGWKDYLRTYNKDRPFILIGHSQGSFTLRQLIANEIDPNAKLRKRLVSAILLGGNVLVKSGKTTGGDFKHIPACRSASSISCVIAFSTFNQAVPAGSLFGRPNAQLGRNAPKGTSVLCAYPGSRQLRTVLPSVPFAPKSTIGVASALIGYPAFSVHTAWVEFDHAWIGSCSSANNAHVLQVSDRPGAPHLKPVPDGTWGLHLTDANIALGNLVGIVAQEMKVFSRRRSA